MRSVGLYNYSNKIDVFAFSKRTQNALRKAEIHTIGDLLNYPVDKLSEIRNMGRKSIAEVMDARNYLSTVDNEGLVKCDSELKHEIISYFDEYGESYIDDKIEDLGLSVRGVNCLKFAGIDFYSQLISLSDNELADIKNAGIKTLNELVELRYNYQPKKYNYQEQLEVSKIYELKSNTYNLISMKLRLESGKFFGAFDDIYSKYNEELLKQSPEDIVYSQSFLNDLYFHDYLKSRTNEYILKEIKNSVYGLDVESILNSLPKCFQENRIVEDSLGTLIEQKQIDTIFEGRYTAVYGSFETSGNKYLDGRDFDVLSLRFQGKTLEEVGEVHEVTRERIRQIESKAIKQLNKLSVKFAEDIYLDVFSKYVLSKEEFIIAFEDIQTYLYLSLRYGTSSSKDKTQKDDLENVLYDLDVPQEFRRACEKAVYKNYVRIGKEYIPCNRDSITKYVLKNNAITSLNFDEFSEVYYEILNKIEMDSNPKLILMERGYENKIASSRIALWKYGRRFRYYNIELHDFEELFRTLDLNQYIDVEYSTFKFFVLYPEVMKEYDIQDEYELHNLLKKICTKKDYPKIKFKRMPNIEFGVANRDNQVMELLSASAPINNHDFASEYENEYGVASNTVLANYLGNFNQFLHNGMYLLDFPLLPEKIECKLRILLNKEFYLLSTIREIYDDEFPSSEKNLLNPYSIKSLGFKVYTKFAIRDTFSSAAEYFNSLLTSEDIVNLEMIPPIVKGIISYTSQLYKLKAGFDIIEFMPNQIISFDRLARKGITKEIRGQAHL